MRTHQNLNRMSPSYIDFLAVILFREQHLDYKRMLHHLVSSHLYLNDGLVKFDGAIVFLT